MKYRRAFTPDSSYFFTLTLQDRTQDLLVRYIDSLRQAFTAVKHRHPFEIIAVCVLPDHLHILIELPENDSNYPMRLRMIKAWFAQVIPKTETTYLYRANAKTSAESGSGSIGNMKSATNRI
ncbi:REP-associated tyrosine transposase [Neisseria iguanae]|uniref:REP-associated tyrosine transposase n=1 Tax=Neisseria iguanae TaxID=90242 RepID=UPI001FEB2486|nr:transposase [Neisseria iguanae]